MNLQRLFIAMLLISLAHDAAAQRVKRKGTTPIDVSKNKRPGSNDAPKFSTQQLVGKWQEASRVDKSTKQPVDITDTLYLNFLKPNKVITRDGNSANMAGDASIESPGNVLIAAADVYTILSVNDSTAVLDNQDNYVHTFKKTDQFFYETFGKNPVVKEEYNFPVPVTMQEVLGNWRVYRRDAKPGAIHPPVNIIQHIKITDSTGENTATGEIAFYQTDQTTVLPCTIKVGNASLDISAGENTWTLFVYKANKNEMVFGDAEVLLYYAKAY